MAVWPAGLPQAPEGPDFQEHVPNTKIRTSMDVGPPKQRQRVTAGIREFDMTFMLTKAQVATLDSFYLTTLAGGALSFDWLHPRTQAAATFQFVTEPAYKSLGPDTWRATCKMAILP